MLIDNTDYKMIPVTSQLPVNYILTKMTIYEYQIDKRSNLKMIVECLNEPVSQNVFFSQNKQESWNICIYITAILCIFWRAAPRLRSRPRRLAGKAPKRAGHAPPEALAQPVEGACEGGRDLGVPMLRAKGLARGGRVTNGQAPGCEGGTHALEPWELTARLRRFKALFRPES